MQFMLMHRDVPVLQFAIFDDRNWAHIVDILNAAHVPVNMLVQPHNRERALNEFIDLFLKVVLIMMLLRHCIRQKMGLNCPCDRIWLVFLTIIGLNLAIVR